MTSEEIIRLRSALQSFSNQLSSHPVVYAVMTFGMSVKTIQKFTSDPGKLDDSLEKLARDSPKTHCLLTLMTQLMMRSECWSEARHEHVRSV